ncbi:MAG: hypothetical protein ACW97X_07910 [Candidatus Hodarchaeales archaeon]|jgi:hypothetical protein
MGHEEVISAFEQTFKNIDIPGIVSIVDSEGMIIYSNNQFDELDILQGIFAQLLSSFEKTASGVSRISSNHLQSVNLTLTSDDEKSISYVVFDLNWEGTYFIIRAEIDLMHKVHPILNALIPQITKTLQSEV